MELGRGGELATDKQHSPAGPPPGGGGGGGLLYEIDGDARRLA